MKNNRGYELMREATPATPATSAIPGWAILPLRFFLGGSFLLAGLDKLGDPSYLNPAARDYIGQQIARFAPGTPLEGFLLNFAVPNAALFGVLTMGGELCIGIAALLGLLTRFSAAMGLLLNLTFFLSATWDVHPFYFGADLPYALGWLTLVLAGPGPMALDHILRRWSRLSGRSEIIGVTGTLNKASVASPLAPDSTLLTRRAVLGAGAVGLVGAVLAATGLGWGIIHAKGQGAVAELPSGSSASPNGGQGGAPNVSTQAPPASAPAPTSEAQATATATPVLATEQPLDAPPTLAPPTDAPPTDVPPTAQAAGQQLLVAAGALPTGQALDFTLASGDPAVLVHNDAGYSAYVAICTHQGCQVSYAPSQGVLRCPCHGAQFDPANGGAPLRGPARRPLSAVAITVDGSGNVYLGE